MAILLAADCKRATADGPFVKLRNRMRPDPISARSDGLRTRGRAPGPVANLGHVLAMFAHEDLVLLEHLPEMLERMPGTIDQAGNAIDRLDREVEAIDLVANHHVEWRGGRSFLL